MKVIVFDFDDTLVASTHISKMRYVDEYGLVVHTPIPELSESIKKIVSIAKSISDHVYIITNSEKDWIEYCIQHYLPGCDFLKEIQTKTRMDIDIVDVPFQEWKTMNFLKTLQPHFDNDDKHELIAFGDSPFDRSASMAVKERFPNVIVKNVLLAMYPSLPLILKEHELIENVLCYMSLQPNHIDLQMNVQFHSDSTSTIQKSSDLGDLGTGKLNPPAPLRLEGDSTDSDSEFDFVNTVLPLDDTPPPLEDIPTSDDVNTVINCSGTGSGISSSSVSSDCV